MKNYLKRMLVYDLWANRKILTMLRDMNEAPDDAIKLLAHLLRAQELWYCRIKGYSPCKMEIWPQLNLDECAALVEQNHKNLAALLEAQDDDSLNQIIAYKNSRGEEFSNPLGDILLHLFNHGTHHRAQIVRGMRQAGTAPQAIDYIFYVRTGDK